MADVVDKATRSRMMAGIRGRDTKPETLVRSGLHKIGFRYRLHVSTLPGKPDLVFPKYNAVILVHGCFWHRHSGCRLTTNPASNSAFWKSKFSGNVDRDARDMKALRKLGWRTAVVWECALRREESGEIAERIGKWLRGSGTTLRIPGKPWC
jgi:DNA mismatch endonuclease (patch repair protein)